MEHQGQDACPANGEGTNGQELLVLSASAERPMLHDIRPDAAFVAQIIASVGHMGPYRRYRRAEPQVALKSYGAGALAAVPPRRMVMA
jgi:hypothetical protein